MAAARESMGPSASWLNDGVERVALALPEAVGRHVQAHGVRLSRFGVVGIAGVAVNMAVLFALVHRFGMNHIVAAGIGSEVSIIGNFGLNDRWTFGDSAPEGSWLARLCRYNAVALGGMALSLAVLAGLTSLAGMHYLVANLVAIGAATLSNYVLNSRFTWTLPTVRGIETAPIALD